MENSGLSVYSSDLGESLLFKKLICLASVAVIIGPSSALAQLPAPIYSWDGDVDQDWSTSANWLEEDTGLDPVAPPDATIRVEIAVTGASSPIIDTDVVVANQIRIGKAAGAGELNMTGGSIDLGAKRFRVGNHTIIVPDPNNPDIILPGFNGGTFNMSGGTLTASDLHVGGGSQGLVTISGTAVLNLTDDLEIDQTFDNDSVLTVTGGTINIADVLIMGFHLEFDRDPTLNMSGGEIHAGDDFRFRGSSNVNLSGGLMRVFDKVEVQEGLLTIDGTGVLRAEEIFVGLDPNDVLGPILINDSGKLHIARVDPISPNTLSVIQGYIDSGFITTDAPECLEISPTFFVDPDFFGDINRKFYEIRVASSPGLDGDFDCNNVVDGLDFLKWQRKDTPGGGSPEELALWEANYGMTGPLSALASVPEPATLTLFTIIAVIGTVGRFGRCRALGGNRQRRCSPLVSSAEHRRCSALDARRPPAVSAGKPIRNQSTFPASEAKED